MPTKMDRFSIMLTDDNTDSPATPEQGLQGTDVNIGGKKYRIMMVTQDDIGFKFLLQKSGTTTQYEVRHNLTPDPAKSWSKEAWSCGCPAWTRHGDPRSCKHTEGVSKLVPSTPSASPSPVQSSDWKKDVARGAIDYCSQNDCEGNGEYRSRAEKILIEDLPQWSTSCGLGGCMCFTKEVIDFLKANSPVDFVVAEVYTTHGKVIQNMAVKWKGSNKKKVMYCFCCGIIARKAAKEDDECKSCGEPVTEGTEWSQMSQRFSQLVDEHKGSLRNEDSFDEGWDCYESE